MSDNPLQFCRIESREARQPRALDLETGSRRVVYGPGVRPRIEIQDEHDEVELKKHGGDILGALRLAWHDHDAKTFLTIGTDHTMVIWRVQGQSVHVLAGHSDCILGVWELTGDRVVSWSADQSVRVWSTRSGATLTRVEARIESTDDLLVGTSGDFLCLMEKSGARMISIGGVELTLLKRQAEKIDEVHRLADGRWITRSATVLKLWSAEGKALRQFSSGFSLEDGYFELPDGRLLVVDTADALALFDTMGSKVAERDADAALARALRGFLRSGKAARKAIGRTPTFEHFEHRRSPISGASIPKEELSKLEISEDQLARNRTFWDFFNRPDFKRIRTWRREDIQTALDARKRAEDALQDHRARETSAKKFRTVAGAALGVTALVFLLTSGVAAVLAALMVAISANISWKQHVQAVKMAKANSALDPLLSETDKLVAEVKAHRRRILASLPFMRSTSQYSGHEVQREMQRIIDVELRETALKNCGLEDVDLKAEPIVLRDWALIQIDQDLDKQSKFSNYTLESFWWTREHGFLFAVQFIQYILLTREKIDVFTVFYDFIRRRMINKTSHAFYYRDVTNISKRDVDRKATLTGVADFSGVEATEIAMVLTSGQRVALTVLNEESTSTLRSGGRKGDAESQAELRRDLVAELEKWRNASDHSQERADEISLLEKQLAALDAGSAADDNRPEHPVRRADEAIKNIRLHIRESIN